MEKFHRLWRIFQRITRKKVEKVKQDLKFHDNIQKLPDDLLLLIFTKLIGFDQHCFLSDIKLVCQCSIVSKRFNSIITLLPSLSVVSESRHELLASFPKIIEKFKHIGSLYVESGYVGFKTKIFNWKATIEPSTTDYYLTGILYDSVEKHSSTQHGNLPLYPQVNNSISSYMCTFKQNISHGHGNGYGFGYGYGYNMCILHESILQQIKNHKRLQHVVITDIERQGSLVLNNKQLVELRNNATSTYDGDQMPCYLKFGTENLELPVSGLLLKQVNLVVFGHGMKSINLFSKDYDDILRAMNFQDDETTIFREALFTIFKKLKERQN